MTADTCKVIGKWISRHTSLTCGAEQQRHTEDGDWQQLTWRWRHWQNQRRHDWSHCGGPPSTSRFNGPFSTERPPWVLFSRVIVLLCPSIMVCSRVSFRGVFFTSFLPASWWTRMNLLWATCVQGAVCLYVLRGCYNNSGNCGNFLHQLMTY